MNCKCCDDGEAEYCEKCYERNRIQEKRKFRAALWKRAGKKCERCPEDDKRVLTVHHLDKQLHPWDVDHALLLCLNCHRKAAFEREREIFK